MGPVVGESDRTSTSSGTLVFVLVLFALAIIPTVIVACICCPKKKEKKPLRQTQDEPSVVSDEDDERLTNERITSERDVELGLTELKYGRVTEHKPSISRRHGPEPKPVEVVKPVKVKKKREQRCAAIRRIFSPERPVVVVRPTKIRPYNAPAIHRRPKQVWARIETPKKAPSAKSTRPAHKSASRRAAETPWTPPTTSNVKENDTDLSEHGRLRLQEIRDGREIDRRYDKSYDTFMDLQKFEIDDWRSSDTPSTSSLTENSSARTLSFSSKSKHGGG